MKQKYAYTRISSPFAANLLKFKNLPLLTVGLRSSSGQMVKIVAYIDTGAQASFFCADYARLLGIPDFRTTKSSADIVHICGIGGTQPQNTAYFHDMQLIVFADQKHLKVADALAVIDTKIGFLENPIQFAGLLGVYGFLDHFSFEANIPHGYFCLEPIF